MIRSAVRFIPNSKVTASQLGFALPLIVIVGLIISAGLMALATRSWLGLNASVRQSQSREAREIAEAGLARVLNSLNTEYSYLLIKDLPQWSDGKYSSSLCPNSTSSGSPATSGTIGSNGKYTLLNYDFRGSPFYGGKADIRVKGERLRGAQTAATSILDITVEIKPKSCTTSFGESTETSGFPGLLGQQIILGGNDIFGSLSGNVLCTRCYSGNDYDSLTREQQEEYIKMNKQGSVAGQIFLGPIDLPAVPTPPASLTFPTPAINLTKGRLIQAGINSADGACKVDSNSPPITHCVFGSITLNGSKDILAVDTSAGDVRIYVTGASVTFTGGSAIKHDPPDATAASLGLFGRAADTDSTNDQTVRLAGAATANKLWAYFPDGTMGINGGAKETAGCTGDGLDEICTGGDIVGALWAKTWNGSSSTIAQLVVPADMGTTLFNTYGPQYALGIRDYVALGVTSWSSWTAQP